MLIREENVLDLDLSVGWAHIFLQTVPVDWYRRWRDRESVIKIVQYRWQKLAPLHQALGDPVELLVVLPTPLGGEVGPLADLEEEYEAP